MLFALYCIFYLLVGTFFEDWVNRRQVGWVGLEGKNGPVKAIERCASKDLVS